MAAELDAVNVERRDVETRILFEAEKLVAETPGGAPAYVLAAEGWHPGVIGIVASRIAERHHRPAVLIALDGEQGTGSGRSIPAFDLLGGLQAASAELLRHGGHRAAAGLTIESGRVDAFREAFVAHAAATLTADDLVPVQRIDAVVPGDALHIGLAEELERLAPFGMGNPQPALLVPGALLGDPRPMGEGRHVSFTLAAGGARSRCVSFGRGSSLPAAPGEPVDAAVRLEINRYNGAVEPRLVLRDAQPVRPAPIEVVGELGFEAALGAELERDLAAWPPADVAPFADDLRGHDDGLGGPGGRLVRDVRGGGIAGLLGDLVHSGAAVLAVTAHAGHRAAVLRDRVGGFAVTTWSALEADASIAAGYSHVVAVDPPAHAYLHALAQHLPGDGWIHLAWGEAELELARRVLAWELDLRVPLAEAYRALRASSAAGADGAGGVAGAGGAAGAGVSAAAAAAAPLTGATLAATLRGTGRQPRSGALAGRLLRVLAELGLVELAADPIAVRVPPAAARTELERSSAFLAYERRLRDGLAYLDQPAVADAPVPAVAVAA